jgi:protein SCO1/2
MKVRLRPRAGAVLAAVLSFAAAAHAAAEPPAAQRVSRTSGGLPVDAFHLIDHHGKPFTEANLLGQWTFIAFGDTQCAAPCAGALAALAGMRDRIAGTSRLKTTQVVFVSVSQESPAELRRYLEPYGEHVIGASGAPRTVARLAEDLGVAAAVFGGSVPASSATGGYEPGVLSLIDPNGIVWGQFLPPFEVKMLTARYLKTRIGH